MYFEVDIKHSRVDGEVGTWLKVIFSWPLSRIILSLVQYIGWMFPFVTSRVSGRGHRIGVISLCVSVSLCLCVSTLTAKPFDLWPWFLVCQSIMAKGLSRKRTVHEGNAGGMWTLRRFIHCRHSLVVLKIVAFENVLIRRQWKREWKWWMQTTADAITHVIRQQNYSSIILTWSYIWELTNRCLTFHLWE